MSPLQAVVELSEQSRLANARLAYNPHHLAAPRLHLRQQRMQGGQGLRTPHEGTLRPSPPPPRGRIPRVDAEDVVSLQRRRLPWDRHRRDSREVDVPLVQEGSRLTTPQTDSHT